MFDLDLSITVRHAGSIPCPLPVSYLQLYWQTLVFGSAVRNLTCPSANLMGFILRLQMSFASHTPSDVRPTRIPVPSMQTPSTSGRTTSRANMVRSDDNR